MGFLYPEKITNGYIRILFGMIVMVEGGNSYSFPDHFEK
jgi:hypothetical protein